MPRFNMNWLYITVAIVLAILLSPVAATPLPKERAPRRKLLTATSKGM